MVSKKMTAVVRVAAANLLATMANKRAKFSKWNPRQLCLLTIDNKKISSFKAPRQPTARELENALIPFPSRALQLFLSPSSIGNPNIDLMSVVQLHSRTRFSIPADPF